MKCFRRLFRKHPPAEIDEGRLRQLKTIDHETDRVRTEFRRSLHRLDSVLEDFGKKNNDPARHH